jgi:putative ABC transport system substrate-binding protein
VRAGVLLAAAILLVPLGAGAQPAAKVHRIGVLEIVEPAANGPNLEAFRQALAELGHVEGRNVAVDYRSAAGRPERLLDLARELIALKPDVLVTRGDPAALAARHATATLPIVMATSGDPVFTGVVASLARPGGNVTGFHIVGPPELGGRRLRLLREAIPATARVGILWDPVGVQLPLIVKDTEKTAAALGVQLKSLEVPRPEAFEPAFEAALMAQVDGLIAGEDTLMFDDRDRIVRFAAMSRLPAIYGLREFVDAGGLMSYGTDRRDLFRRAAGYVDRILKGARPADLPVEPPVKFELAVNLKTAKAIGLTLPPSLVRRADYVVE